MALPLVRWPLHSLITLFSFLFRVLILSDLDFQQQVLWPTSLCPCSRRCSKLGSTISGPRLLVLNFFSVSFTTLLDQAVCRIYKWVVFNIRGVLCNHCDQLMDGRSLEDVILKRNPPSLTEDDVIDFLCHSDPDHNGWDDGVIRMIFCINSYLRSVPSLP